MKTIGQMIQQLDGLHDTVDVNDWENQFIADMVRKTDNGKRTTHLSEKQVAAIENIYVKHFA